MAGRRNSSQFAGVEQVNKVFMNGDKYTGGWKGGRPQGEGCYCWFDGSKYTGNWKEGKKEGLGTYNWPSGGQYHGEWVNGAMHGVGTFEALDGTSYSGSWYQDMKHGLGRKVFSNRDVYEGLWRENRHHGPGRYRWGNRDEYDGEWSLGRMHGRGTLRWRTGDRYDGEFKDGLEVGIGIFTWSSGSTYHGFWKAGMKHGLGVYRPSLIDRCPREPGHFEEVTVHNKITEMILPAVPRASYEFEKAAQHQGGFEASENHFGHEVERPIARHNLEHVAGLDAVPGSLPQSNSTQSILMQEFENGKLLRQELLTAEELEAVFGKDDDQKVWQRDLFRSNREKHAVQGQHIYKGHRSYDLMLNLQLGIRFSVGKDFPEDLYARTILPQHFRMQRAQDFPRDGGRDTPPHPTADFSWKDYCPLAFKKLRGVFSIDRANFVTSLCGDQALREMPSTGKSGSVFFLSHDGKYVIKTMRKGEIKLLLKLLPQYVEHVQQYPHTLLVKFYGLYRITPKDGRKVRFIVMNNLFQTDLPIHRKYDLKGSTQGRFSSPGPDVILKDCNLDIRLSLDSTWHEKLMQQLEVDCELLEELRVMDYSLLLGIHFKNSDAGPGGNVDGDVHDDASNADANRLSADQFSRDPSPKIMSNSWFHEEADVFRSTDTFPEGPAQGQTAAEYRRENNLKLRILKRLGCGHIDEQKMQDLLKLAQFRMLSKEPHNCTASMVLACRSSMAKKPNVELLQGSEATDELTQRLGGCRIQLGMNMQAHCLPQPGKQCTTPEAGVCYFGIIDILQEYNYIKRLEHAAKSVRHGSSIISAVHPRTYSSRFQKFLKNLFE